MNEKRNEKKKTKKLKYLNKCQRKVQVLDDHLKNMPSIDFVFYF